MEGVGGAGADCVEGMGSSHVRESWAWRLVHNILIKDGASQMANV